MYEKTIKSTVASEVGRGRTRFVWQREEENSQTNTVHVHVMSGKVIEAPMAVLWYISSVRSCGFMYIYLIAKTGTGA